ncbi:GatB/YqeY domain-containing protein [Levilactobacillus bambusae]|uniref:Aspartyl-tRNA amidotransferase n=1 Tax=Levilactobacillus bambusae TaxID=2024736 RepID=A0A2V1N288_9LACO|nr:GatB/YqeY domain-containing protein [Levilactobacillus bambusae]PWG00768.1 hypothetical protein DCM90_00910 [Levilactobacillus bambusae]
MSQLQDQLTADLKTAMKAHDKMSLNVIRMIKAAIQNEQVKVGHDLTEDEEIAILNHEVKTRQESINEFQAGNRQDLVDATNAELEIVNRYAPALMTADEVNQVVAETIAQVGATGKGDFGKVMGAVMGKVKGRADGNMVKSAVQAQLV